MKILNPKNFQNLPELKLGVAGHVEWVRFLSVDNLPQEGLISHSKEYKDLPAGGGAVAAVQMRNLTNGNVHFFTALGKDKIGEQSYQELEKLGLKLRVSWKDKPTRQGISFVDSYGERAITVIGERLEPSSKDLLQWDELSSFDAIFMTAGDSELITLCRQANLLTATPRIGINALKEANVRLDLLVGSALDPGEKYNPKELSPMPKIMIRTKGASGGDVIPGGKYKPVKLLSKIVDTYGCGDKFAAGVTTGLAANWNIEESISLGAHCGALGATYFGPYQN